ncbi:hypothetical protein [Pseudonocardia nigra]|uniref:hypothetical protein n=1 Tax=Pseudonocardia nigra TaxID=1921578 RepID=UPI001C5E3EFF|nr:hypothetical protein [Pseudonocardia nigra]
MATDPQLLLNAAMDRLVRVAAVLAALERIRSDPQFARCLYGPRKVWHQLRREGGVGRHLRELLPPAPEEERAS